MYSSYKVVERNIGQLSWFNKFKSHRVIYTSTSLNALKGKAIGHNSMCHSLVNRSSGSMRMRNTLYVKFFMNWSTTSWRSLYYYRTNFNRTTLFISVLCSIIYFYHWLINLLIGVVLLSRSLGLRNRILLKCCIHLSSSFFMYDVTIS